MSLEQELARNTEALLALTAALQSNKPVTEKAAPPKPVDTPTVKEVSPAAAPTPAGGSRSDPKPSGSSTTPTNTTPTNTASVTSNTTPTIEYPAVAAAITSVFRVDRARPIAALAKFGVAKGPQLKPEDYAAFLVELGA